MVRQFAVPPDRLDRLATLAAPTGAGAALDRPAEPRPAGTVMLLRDGLDGVEVFLLRRVRGMAFAAGMHVFPGGSVEPSDAQPCPWAGTPAQEWQSVLDAPSEGAARAIVVAAVRETFEECGVLLASRPGGEPVLDGAPAAWEAERAALVAGTTALAELLARRGLVLRADLLVPWAHWLTPTFESRRFDTRFFAVAMPTGQHAREVTGEADRAAWVPAAEALRAYDAGEVALLPPTLVCLEDLVEAGSVVAALATPRRPTRVAPWLGRDAAGRVVIEADLDDTGRQRR